MHSELLRATSREFIEGKDFYLDPQSLVAVRQALEASGELATGGRGQKVILALAAFEHRRFGNYEEITAFNAELAEMGITAGIEKIEK